eukprot:5660210-Amphidinium_carterae.1
MGLAALLGRFQLSLQLGERHLVRRARWMELSHSNGGVPESGVQTSYTEDTGTYLSCTPCL